jgi:hypothetical protein
MTRGLAFKCQPFRSFPAVLLANSARLKSNDQPSYSLWFVARIPAKSYTLPVSLIEIAVGALQFIIANDKEKEDELCRKVAKEKPVEAVPLREPLTHRKRNPIG